MDKNKVPKPESFIAALKAWATKNKYPRLFYFYVKQEMISKSVSEIYFLIGGAAVKFTVTYNNGRFTVDSSEFDVLWRMVSLEDSMGLVPKEVSDANS